LTIARRGKTKGEAEDWSGQAETGIRKMGKQRQE